MKTNEEETKCPHIVSTPYMGDLYVNHCDLAETSVRDLHDALCTSDEYRIMAEERGERAVNDLKKCRKLFDKIFERMHDEEYNFDYWTLLRDAIEQSTIQDMFDTLSRFGDTNDGRLEEVIE